MIFFLEAIQNPRLNFAGAKFSLGKNKGKQAEISIAAILSVGILTVGGCH